ncbi:MAG: DMT family transporter [Candidatus Woesearchaeota archaeon]
MIEPFLAIVGGASAVLFSRQVLSTYKLGFKEYLSLAFWMNCLIMLPFLYWMNNFSLVMLFKMPVLYMAGLILTACIYNFFYFKGFAHERLSEVQSLMLLIPLFATGFAYAFYPVERHIVPVVMAIVATLFLVWAHVSHGHVKFTKNSIYVLIAVIFFGLEYVFMKKLLEVYNPFTLYFVRCFIIGVIFFFMWGVRYSSVKPKAWKYLVAAQVSYVIQFIAVFWSVEKNGIVLTNVVLNLIPVLVFTYSYFHYRDHPGWKKMLAGFVILICIVIAQLYR